MIAAEAKKSIFKKFGNSEKNTGSAESQIALFTERINSMTQHLQESKKDFSTQRALIALVGKRRSLLDYLQKTDIEDRKSVV